MAKEPKHRNPRNEKSTEHIGGAAIKRVSSILDAEELDKNGLSIRDY